MRYRTDDPKDAAAATARLFELIKANKEVEIKEVKKRRSLSQNAFLHLLLTDFAMFLGCTIEEAKLEYKRINADIYQYTRKLGSYERPYFRSSAELSREEMMKSIDKLRDVAARMGHPLPEAHDPDWERYITNEAERMAVYL